MQKTILVVEDEGNLRSFLRNLLTANNFKVIEAADGAQALEDVERFSPDLVLLDFGLPKVSGETVCVKIKKDHPNIIVIVLTEKTTSSDVVHGLQIGADDFISKPFAAEELIARIDTRFKTNGNGKGEFNHENQIVEPNQNKKVIFKESVVLIILRLILTEGFFALSFLVFGILFSYLSTYINTAYYSGIYFLVLTVGFLANIFLVVMINLKWNSEYIEVSSDGVIKHSGILHRKEQRYACNFVEGTKLEQSFLGMLLNYGTIGLYDPALKEEVFLVNIANPKRSSEIIQSIISKVADRPMPFLTQENN